MRLSTGFWQTYKEIPSDAEIISHQLMLRAGLIHKSGAGLYNYLPIGLRAIKKFEKIVREEMEAIDCHELLMSVVTPGELWQESGRWDKMEGLMLRFKDKSERDLCISPTNEEAIVDIFKKTVRSYKQLPMALYQINTKFRDEIRPRFGLMRGREFTMKDAYSFHLDKPSLDVWYEKFYQAYTNIFTRAGLKFKAVEADGGAIASADSKTHEFQLLADAGEDIVVYSEKGTYAANIEKAQTERPDTVFEDPQGTDMEEVDTPKMSTIKDVCQFLKKSESSGLKALVYSSTLGTEKELVMALMLGDDGLNEVKLKNFLKCETLRMATDEELKTAKLPVGYIGPVGLTVPVRVILDKAVNLKKAYVVGALKWNKHLKNFIPEKHLEKFEQTDLRQARAGDYLSGTKEVVAVTRGIEVGHIFQLGKKYSEAMNASVLGNDGKPIIPTMGCYGIGTTRTVAASIEQNHDKDGIIWPVPLAPYHVYFLSIGKTPEIKTLSEEVYQELKNQGFEVLYDDRDMGPGGMFKDADLLGLPLRLVLGEKEYTANQLFELKIRKTGEVLKLSKTDIFSYMKKYLKENGVTL